MLILLGIGELSGLGVEGTLSTFSNSCKMTLHIVSRAKVDQNKKTG